MSRHLVKFVEADGQLWAVKDMPPRVAVKEYDVLRRLEDMGLPAVHPAGLVLQPDFETAILVTRYLQGSWQYRRLFLRLPPRPAQTPGAAAGCDGGPVGGVASPRGVLG